MVRPFRVAARDRHQRGRRLLHHDLRAEIREGTLHQLVDIDGRLLFSEYPRHSAAKGAMAQIISQPEEGL